MAKEVVERIFCKSIDVKNYGQCRFESEKLEDIARDVAIATSVSTSFL